MATDDFSLLDGLTCFKSGVEPLKPASVGLPCLGAPARKAPLSPMEATPWSGLYEPMVGIHRLVSTPTRHLSWEGFPAVQE